MHEQVRKAMSAYSARKISVKRRSPNYWRNFTSNRLADMEVIT